MTVKPAGLRFGPLSPATAHVCVDMQRLFAEDTEWKTPWIKRGLPQIVHVVAAHPERTIFTRFIPAKRPGEGQGVWSRYWQRWTGMTVASLGTEMVEIIPDLASFTPPALVVDK
jgi:nicotinamidase-related amidase